MTALSRFALLIFFEFAAVRESAVGPERQLLQRRDRSGSGVKPTCCEHRQTDVIDPERHGWACNKLCPKPV